VNKITSFSYQNLCHPPPNSDAANKESKLKHIKRHHN